MPITEIISSFCCDEDDDDGDGDGESEGEKKIRATNANGHRMEYVNFVSHFIPVKERMFGRFDDILKGKQLAVLSSTSESIRT